MNKQNEIPPAKKDQPDEANKPALEGMEQIMSSSMSVLDRLRARKKAASQNDERQEATLTDVATAIAAASGEANRANGAATHSESEALDMPQWSKALLKSVDETREELKEANTNIGRLKSAAAETKGARKERREKIAEGLARADALLNEIRQAQE